MITYNHAPYIAQAIEGVLQQKTDFPFELVIGEDCSTDGTRKIVFEYQKKYRDIIRVITTDKNVGMRKNGYRTTKACRGKYIAFCEGDDYWHRPDKLQLQVNYMESHPECGLVCSSYDLYNLKSRKRIKNCIKYHNWEIPKSPGIADFLERRGAMAWGFLTCTIMVRRALCEQIIESDPSLYQSDKFLRGDTQLWAEIANVAFVHYIPESLATYNITDESATRSADIRKSLRLQINDAELGLYLCDKYNLPAAVRNKQEALWGNGLLRLAFYTRSKELADEARRKKKIFTWKEWLQYYGAKNQVFYYVIGIAISFRNLFKKGHILY
jgi:glycosyltransferase involved in cell wall biosynthesis